MCTVKPHNGGIPKTKEPRMRWQQSLVLQFWNVLTIWTHLQWQESKPKQQLFCVRKFYLQRLSWLSSLALQNELSCNYKYPTQNTKSRTHTLMSNLCIKFYVCDISFNSVGLLFSRQFQPDHDSAHHQHPGQWAGWELVVYLSHFGSSRLQSCHPQSLLGCRWLMDNAMFQVLPGLSLNPESDRSLNLGKCTRQLDCLGWLPSTLWSPETMFTAKSNNALTQWWCGC
jgi:hypothetical protein